MGRHKCEVIACLSIHELLLCTELMANKFDLIWVKRHRRKRVRRPAALQTTTDHANRRQRAKQYWPIRRASNNAWHQDVSTALQGCIARRRPRETRIIKAETTLTRLKLDTTLTDHSETGASMKCRRCRRRRFCHWTTGITVSSRLELSEDVRLWPVNHHQPALTRVQTHTPAPVSCLVTLIFALLTPK